MTNDERLKILRALQRKGGGILHPADVVEAARPPESPLHGEFEWDDSVAAEKWRIEQAREMIRVTVVYEPRNEREIKAFVVLERDRVEGGGYRYVPALLRTTTGRDDLLSVALSELRTFQQKYRHLSELAGVFAEIEEATARNS